MTIKFCFRKVILPTLFMIIFPGTALTQTLLDGFEQMDEWSFIRADGVELELSIEEGFEGQAIRLDYDFTKGTGYGGIQKRFLLDLSGNFEISFYLKAESPSNNFEIKFIDPSGENVWWVNNRNYEFPIEWTKIRVRPRHIDFAWGPATDRELKHIGYIEFTIASYVGGKGSVWIDNLVFQPLDPLPEVFPDPLITASSCARKSKANMIMDGSSETWWLSMKGKKQFIELDLGLQKQFGGLYIQWLEGYAPYAFEVLVSNHPGKWEKVYEIENNLQSFSFIWLPESEAKYLRLNLFSDGKKVVFGMKELKLLDIENSLTKNDFLRYVAAHSPRGDYPGYFLDQASYWTVMGVNNDVSEALINEVGMVEVEKARFSIEPMIKIEDQLFNWANVEVRQMLDFFEDFPGFQFSPSVCWDLADVQFVTGILASGDANKSSRLNIGYSFKNLSGEMKHLECYLLIRPFQVNPYYQFLNFPGGAGKIEQIGEASGGREVRVDDKIIYSLKAFDEFSAFSCSQGSPADLIRREALPVQNFVFDGEGMANGVIKYSISLKPGEQTEFYLVAPFHEQLPDTSMLTNEKIREDFLATNRFWEKKIEGTRYNLPGSADRILETIQASLIYTLINRDKAGIQPGSRSYERSWIRDGSLTSSALLKAGIVEEVYDFIQWYTHHQYENGKVPCVVDFRGPDPVPENDSHGQLIYLIAEYFKFTKDTAFLREMNPHVVSAVEYIQSLIDERSTDYFKFGNDSIRAYFGLVPESISHEGYSAKPMHSYWDNFFTLKGLKDAVEIQETLGEEENLEKFKKIRNHFSNNLYNSIDLAMKLRGIDYIPGCVELGDFDPTSTTVALAPCNELNHLPEFEIYNTFERYYSFFKGRKSGEKDWVDFTPYENRIIGSFILLDQPDRAHELLEFFLDYQRPRAWNQWPEIVWRDYRAPRFIGDMPHTWVSSDFLNAIRIMFVYENEYEKSLVLAAALYQDWIDAEGGMSVENLPTYYGNISYSILKNENYYVFNIYGNVDLPENGLEIRNFNGQKKPVHLTINGKESSDFSKDKIRIMEFPAEVVICY